MTMRSSTRLGFAIGAVLLGSALPASAQSGQADSPVVVTGRRATPVEANRQVLRAITPRVRFDEPLPRVTASLCVKVGGLKPAILQAIADRIVTNAMTAGLNVLDGKCQANVLVLFVGDGQAEAQQLLQKEAWIFGDESPQVIRQFVNAAGPSRMYKQTSAVSRDGDVGNASATLTLSDGQDLEVDAPVLKQPSATRVGPAVRRSIDGVVLVIDRQSLLNKTPIQIADFATMKTLADGRYSEEARNDTILSLFAEGVTPPNELTRIDRSLLRALYADRQLQTAAAEINDAADEAAKP